MRRSFMSTGSAGSRSADRSRRPSRCGAGNGRHRQQSDSSRGDHGDRAAVPVMPARGTSWGGTARSRSRSRASASSTTARRSTATRSRNRQHEGRDHHLRRDHPGSCRCPTAAAARPTSRSASRTSRVTRRLRGGIRIEATPNPAYFGAIIGRYGNRIAKGEFALDGETYTLDINNGPEQPPRRLPRVRQAGLGRQPDRAAGPVGVELTRTSEEGEGCMIPPSRRAAPATRATCRSRSPTRSTSTTTCGWNTPRRPTRRPWSTSPTTPTGTWRARARGRSTTTS